MTRRMTKKLRLRWIAVGLLVAAVAVGRAGVAAIEPAAAADADSTGVPA